MKCRIQPMKKLDRVRSETVSNLSPVAITAMLWVCEKKLHFGGDKIRKAAIEISSSYDSISRDYVTFDDLRECLRDDDGVNVPFDFDHKIEYHTTDDAIEAAAYAQKAFACVVLCTVLCDKFAFGKTKAQQAVKQVCDTFDAMRADRGLLREARRRYREEYFIAIT